MALHKTEQRTGGSALPIESLRAIRILAIGTPPAGCIGGGGGGGGGIGAKSATNWKSTAGACIGAGPGIAGAGIGARSACTGAGCACTGSAIAGIATGKFSI